MQLQYDRLLGPSSTIVAEGKEPYLLFTERHLQAMWLDQKYFSSLHTPTGTPVQVISPGIWNLEAGPDFRNAHVRIGGRDVFGDVELHLSDDGWMAHGHHEDPRYNDVVLHISLWQAQHSKSLTTVRGTSPTCVYMEHALTISLRRIVSLIDLDLYPYQKHGGSGRCSQGLFEALPKQQVEQFFQSAALWRLSEKLRYLSMRVDNPALRLGAGIAMALGYKHNTASFLQLFLSLNALASSRPQELLTIALGRCGFFDDPHATRWKSSSFYQSMLDQWKSTTFTGGPYHTLNLAQVRPLNHPVRRLAYLCHLLADPHLLTLEESLHFRWQEKWHACRLKRDFVQLREYLLDVTPNYSDPYWNSHYTFESNATTTFLPFIGDGLKTEILVNTFLPLLKEKIASRGHPQEIETFNTFYRSIPASHTSKTHYLTQRFFGDHPNGSTLTKAFAEQGAYQVHRDFCLHHEASCIGCPFVERYRTVFQR